MSQSEDNDALLALGRASVRIVHDLKNQLNGLKLYATFLRKRLEKREGQTDELETINKLISGLDRTATDLSMIVEYGQPVDLQRRTETDLAKILSDVVTTLNALPPASGALTRPVVLEAEPGPFVGEFDSGTLAGALESISLGALKMVSGKKLDGALEIRLQRQTLESKREGVMEWRVGELLSDDPFHSFAGSNEIRLSLAARVIEAHGGSAQRHDGSLCVRLPLTR